MQTLTQRFGWSDKGATKQMNPVNEIEQMTTRVADGVAAAAAAGAGASWLTNFDTWVHIAASFAAAFAALAAAAFHIYKIVQLHRITRAAQLDTEEE
jgi:hypothetical protein